MNKKFIIILVVVFLLIAGYLVFVYFQSIKAIVKSGDLGLVELKPKAISNVVVYDPKSDDEISLPFKVRGRARVFESVVNFEVLDQKTNKVLFEGYGMTNAPDMGFFGDFEKEIQYLFSLPETENIILNVFWASPKDGSRLDTISIPLKINLKETSKIKLFFNNDKLDPEFSCNRVFPVERIISKTQTPARKALELLLEGPASIDNVQGFFTSINSDVKIQSLTIENGVAKVDFDEQLEFQVGGSCRVSAIRAQITQTLKQFPTVKEVIISINGRTEDILQP